MARRHETPHSYYLTPRLVCATAALPVQCCRRRTLGVETALRSQHKKLRNLFSQLNSAGGLQLSTAGFSAVCLCQLKTFKRTKPFWPPLNSEALSPPQGLATNPVPWLGLVIIDFSHFADSSKSSELAGSTYHNSLCPYDPHHPMIKVKVLWQSC